MEATTTKTKKPKAERKTLMQRKAEAAAAKVTRIEADLKGAKGVRDGIKKIAGSDPSHAMKKQVEQADDRVTRLEEELETQQALAKLFADNAPKATTPEPQPAEDKKAASAAKRAA